jgi:hypothetical protein
MWLAKETLVAVCVFEYVAIVDGMERINDGVTHEKDLNAKGFEEGESV